MGCGSSKLDDLPAVILCKERCGFLDEAINLRFALAESHLAYTHSLKTIGASLHRFIEHDLQGGAIVLEPLSPKKVTKRDLVEDEGTSSSSPKKKSHDHHLPIHSRSDSNSGSHLNFHSDSDDDDDDDEFDASHLQHLEHSSPLHNNLSGGGGGDGGYGDYMSGSDYMNNNFNNFYDGGGGGGGGGGFLRMNYMKNQSTPVSVVYEQRPVTNGTIRFLDAGAGGLVDNNNNDNDNNSNNNGGLDGVLKMNYMKNKARPPSVVYEQRQMMPERVQYGEASSSSYYYPNNPYQPSTSTSYPYYGYQNYDGDVGGGGGVMGYYGSPSRSGASSSKPPPPPPPPPSRGSTFDFLNLFDGYDSFYPSYTPSRNSKDVRDEEGIPDLEDEVVQREVVKEVHGGHKYAAAEDGVGNFSKPVMVDDVDDKVGEEANASLYQSRPSVSMENDRVEYHVHVIDKKVVDDERPSVSNSSGFKGGSRGVSEVAVIIKIQFERASESGNEIAQMLEVGKLRYQRKYVSKMSHGVTPPLSVIASQPPAPTNTQASSSAGNNGPPTFEVDEDLTLRSKNLSSTLQKLYLWEKKLYNEVKAEEKMRVDHDRKCRKLKRLDQKGAEAHKVDTTRTLIRSLSTKIRMAIQVVDNISVTINKIRDEELWPQLNELIQGLTRMWKNMLECHHNQCQAIREAGGFDSIRSTKRFGDAHLDFTLELEHELINWTSNFSSWISAQKGYVRALNNWLVKCLWYEPEETPDGIVPFSPGRIGAPPVFVICNQWAQAMDRISEKEVLDAMRTFAASIFHLWEQDKVEMRQRMMANKDLERKVRNLDREDQKMQKEIQALDKKLVSSSGDGSNLSVSGNVVYQSDTRNTSLQGCLQQIFDAMERFTAESLKVYEELIQRSEEEKVAQQQEIAS